MGAPGARKLRGVPGLSIKDSGRCNELTNSILEISTMKTSSMLLLLNDNTRKLYAFTVTTDRQQSVEQEKNGPSQRTPCYVVTGAFCQWIYFLVVPVAA
jgi:hypothetical protein